MGVTAGCPHGDPWGSHWLSPRRSYLLSHWIPLGVTMEILFVVTTEVPLGVTIGIPLGVTTRSQ